MLPCVAAEVAIVGVAFEEAGRLGWDFMEVPDNAGLVVRKDAPICSSWCSKFFTCITCLIS